MKLFALAVVVAAGLASSAAAQQLAFPGAEGFGRFAEGGRGGSVYPVTTLANAGPGSLRACVEAKGPRTCVFRVAGQINLSGPLDIVNPRITIAGQTAPGQGITLTNEGGNIHPPLRILAGNVVVRHIRSRPGGPTHKVSSNGDAFRVGGTGSLASSETVADIILDHVTMSWATDELVDPSPWMDRLTIQDSLIYEGLKVHSKGPNLRACGVSLIRNVIANNIVRNPNNTCGFATTGNVRNGGGQTGENEIRNNLVFNASQGFLDYWNGRGDSEVNIAGNVFLRGPNTPRGKTMPYAVDARDITSAYNDNGLTAAQGFVPAGTSDRQTLCLQDNLSEGFPGDQGFTARAPEAFGVLDPRDAHLVASTDCVNRPVGNPLAAGGVRGLTGPVIPSAQLEARLLPGVGALSWSRDTADERVIDGVGKRQGSFVTTVAEAGGYPRLATGIPYQDADLDGMDDAWEFRAGVTDATADADGDGYTNLEEFLSELAGDPAF